MMGTPHYMSPEQMLSSKHVDLRADLWAVAVLAYHALTGDVPFDGETFGAVAIAVTQAEFAPISAKYGVGSPELDAWFARALARDLNARFTSADELADTFARAAGSGFADVGGTGSGQRVVQAATVNTSPAHAAPTFGGVSNTVPRRGPGKLYVAAGVLALAGASSLALLLMRAPTPPPPTIAATGASVAPAPSEVPISVPAPSSSSLPIHVEPAIPVPPSASAPVSHARPPALVRARPKVGPTTTPPNANTTRPDRGF